MISLAKPDKIIKKILAAAFKPLILKAGLEIIPHQKLKSGYPPDFSDLSIAIYKSVKPYTMTGKYRVNALVNAVQYIVENKIEGSMVECGVWKGGTSMAIALTLKKLGDEKRELYLYDTYSGMCNPSDKDVSIYGLNAKKKFTKTKRSGESSSWCLSNLEEVRENMNSTGYQKHKMHFIEGKVQETIPKYIPKKIALLRLDTDWYESTKHELTHLYPLLQPNGVLIIDDYGHWEGARKAVDEYIAVNNIKILLNRIDYSGRIAVKT